MTTQDSRPGPAGTAPAGTLPAPWARLAFLWRRLAEKYRECGLAGTLGIVRKNLRAWAEDRVSRRYDRQQQVQTAGYQELQDLDIESPNKPFGIRYQPTTHKRLLAMFSCLPAGLGAFTFVDFGSGRGRVLLFASQFGFKRIVGVEFSQALHRSALDNIARARARPAACRDVVSLHQDAAQFEIPAGPLVLYFFDPFRDQVMQQVLDRVRQSYLDDPRTVYLMYLAPVHEAMVEATGIFRRLRTPELPREFSLPQQYRFALYVAQAPVPAKGEARGQS